MTVCVVCDGATLARTGVGTHTLTLLRALRRAGVRTVLLTSGVPPPAGAEADRVEALDVGASDIRAFPAAALARLARLDVDAVHFNNLDTAPDSRPASPRPVWTATLHTDAFLRPRLRPALAALAARLDALVTVSEAHARELAGVELIPNGVDLALFRRRVELPDDGARPLRALLPTRLVQAKRVELAGAIVRELAGRLGRRVALVATGERDEALAAAAGGPLSAAGFCGWRGYAEMPALYAGADLVLAPSLIETYGLTVAEALAVGVPVFVPAGTPGARALERAGLGDGVVCDHDEPEAWAGRIAHVLAAPAAAGAGRAWVEAEADADGMAARYLALWRRLGA